MTIPPVIIVGPLTLHLYGLLLGLGFVAALQVISQINKHTSMLCEKNLNLLVWIAVAGGIVGARLYHVVDQWMYYRAHVALIPQVWRGGLGIYGGMAGGVMALVLCALAMQTKKQSKRGGEIKLSVTQTLKLWFDVAALGLPLGQAIGRLGNWVNQELYGLPTTLPWGIYIAPDNRLSGFEAYSHFHPLFAYEAVWMLLTFAFLYGYLYRSKKIELGAGLYVLGYLGSYAVIRFGLDFLRINPWRLGILTVAQWISLVLIGVAIGLLLKARKSMLR